MHCLYKKLQTCLPTSRRPGKPYLFLPWVFHRRLFKVLRKKNEIHCTYSTRRNDARKVTKRGTLRLMKTNKTESVKEICIKNETLKRKDVPTCHVMVSMALTNQRRSSQGRKTAYGNERAVDLSTARLSGPWTNPRPARKTSKGRC